MYSTRAFWKKKTDWSVARFRKKFSTLCSLHRVLNSAPLCIFSTLLHKSEENCFTNIPHPLTKTFCKQPCDWLINRGWGKFSTLWHIQHPTEPAEVQHPLGVLNSAPYRACWKCFLKQKIHHSLGPKGDEANSAGCRGCWISFWNGPQVYRKGRHVTDTCGLYDYPFNLRSIQFPQT